MGLLQARILEWVFPSPEDLLNPGIESMSPALQANSLPLSHQGSIYICIYPFIVDEHLGYFHILAIVNGAAMNIGVHVSFQIMAFSDICPGVELQDHMVAPYLVS